MKKQACPEVFLPNVKAIFDVLQSAIVAPPYANQHSKSSRISSQIASWLLALSGVCTFALLLMYGGFRVFHWRIPGVVLWGMLVAIEIPAFAALTIEGATSLFALLRISKDPIARQFGFSLLQLEHDIRYLPKLIGYSRIDLISAKNYLENQLNRFEAVRNAFAGPVAKVGLLPVAVGFAAVAPKIRDAFKGTTSEPTVWTVLIACAVLYLLTWATQGHPMRLGLGVDMLQQAIDVQEEMEKSDVKQDTAEEGRIG